MEGGGRGEGGREVRGEREREREERGEEKMCLFSGFFSFRRSLPCVIFFVCAQRVPVSTRVRLVWAFFFFFLLLLFSPPLPPPPRFLASGTGSEALIWLPVRQQPFNNNAIVPHSSSPVSLIHPAVCRWYIVCGKHSPF